MTEQYEQLDIFGGSDLQYAEDTAIQLIKTFEEVALARCPEHGYIVGYSGGKDSDCLVHLFMRSGVKFKLMHNHTTLDIPDTVYYVSRKFEEWTEQGYECEIYKPEKSFWKLCEEKAMLPFRRFRFCCAELKEKQPYENAVYSFGVRKFESKNRENNRDSIETRDKKDWKTTQRFHFDKDEDVKQMETCYTNKYFVINPMAYWTTEVRDKYIAKYGIEVNPVYEKYGLKRCGCIMCPMCSDSERQKEAELFPKYALNFRLLCDRIIKKRHESTEKLAQFNGGGGSAVSKIRRTPKIDHTTQMEKPYSERIYIWTANELYDAYIDGFRKSNYSK